MCFSEVLTRFSTKIRCLLYKGMEGLREGAHVGGRAVMYVGGRAASNSAFQVNNFSLSKPI